MKLFGNIIKSPQNVTITSTPTDLTHVTQEMYKKNFELAEKNKTLLILRKIDEIILSTVTDIKEIAQHAADVVAIEADFKAVLIYLYHKQTNQLVRLALSETDLIKHVKENIHATIFRDTIIISQDHNIIEKAINERTRKVTSELTDMLVPDLPFAEQRIIGDLLQIKSSIIYPLIVRGEVIGSIIFSLGQPVENLGQFQQDLIERLVGVIGIAIDNALLYQKIEEANQKLKQLDALKDEFVSLASHELRTPMTVIKSYMWMVLHGKGGALTEKQTFYLDRVYQSTDRLIAFVNEMLNVSRIESNRITIRIKPTRLDALVQEIVSEIEPRAQELKVKLIVVPSNNLPLVAADPDKIREVIVNLIGNSMKFTSPGGTITIAFDIEDGFVRTEVKDTGVGMSAEDLPKLFHKFGMVGNNYLTKTNSQGTGLGLYISKSIVELHGGKIWAFSEGIGRGSRFSFTLKITNEPSKDTKDETIKTA